MHKNIKTTGVIKWVYLLDGRLPKIWEGEKRPKFGTISDNWSIILLQNTRCVQEMESLTMKNALYLLFCTFLF